jgi:hypothetical protein
MRRFHLVRKEDASGVSGTGHVAEGILFSDGRVVINWCLSHKIKVASIVIYQSLPDAIAVHGHDGKTTVDFIDTDFN